MTRERRVIFGTMPYQRYELLARPSGDIYSGSRRETRPGLRTRSFKLKSFLDKDVVDAPFKSQLGERKDRGTVLLIQLLDVQHELQGY
jgi:hypothetical protein